MGQNSCQPEGSQPESAMAALLVLAIERLLPSPGALPSPILAATHTCFTMLGTLAAERATAPQHQSIDPEHGRQAEGRPDEPENDRSDHAREVVDRHAQSQRFAGTAGRGIAEHLHR